MTADYDLTKFVPDAHRGRLVDARVRDHLADSIATLFDALADERVSVARAARLLEQIRSGPISPGVFGLYTDLVEAVLDEDMARAGPLLQDFFAADFSRNENLRIVNLTPGDLGGNQVERYRQLVNDDPARPVHVAQMAQDDFRTIALVAQEALALLDDAAPELAGEIRGLLRELVLVTSAEGAGLGGASTFYLWGAMFLNGPAHPDRVSIAEALAHESGHTLLFGLGMGSPLVENSPEERYPSPLRRDLRPLEGIVHATYVSARMCYALTRLLESDLLTKKERSAVLAARDRDRGAYRNGLQVVSEHARWTPIGAAAFEAARRYMSDASGL